MEAVQLQKLVTAIDSAEKQGVKAAGANSTDWLPQADNLVPEIQDFIIDRLKGYYADRGVPATHFNAVAERKPASLYDFDRRIEAIGIFAALPEAEALAAANKRIGNSSNQIKLGKYILEADHATLKDTQDGKQKMLTAREAKILELLAVNKNEVVRREAVLSRFWGVEDKDYFASRSLDVFIKKIRTALEDEPGVELKTIRGVGFKLIAE